MLDGIKGMSESLKTVLYWTKAMRRRSKKSNIRELQLKYGAVKEKVFKISLTNEVWPMFFQVKDGEFNVWYDDRPYDAEIIMTTDTFLNIMHRRCFMTNQHTGKREPQPFSFWDARRFGLVKGKGHASTNDFKSFAQMFDDLIQEIHEERNVIDAEDLAKHQRPLA